MQALHEHGIKPEILSGVSAGALAAVFYADGKEPSHIVELFEHHSFKELTTFSCLLYTSFYLGGVYGSLLSAKSVKNKFLYIPYYFLFMHINVIKGCLLYTSRCV